MIEMTDEQYKEFLKEIKKPLLEKVKVFNVILNNKEYSD